MKHERKIAQLKCGVGDIAMRAGIEAMAFPRLFLSRCANNFPRECAHGGSRRQ
jgi:hypothetical protein